MNEDVYSLKVVRLESGEIEIIGNRTGLRELAAIKGLADLTDDEARMPANHFHFADYMNTANEGSLELLVRFDPEL